MQTGEAHGRAAWRHAARALALGLAAVLLGSAVTAWRRTAAEGYWAAGYYRLLADALWERFDGALPVVIPVALAAGALVAVLRRGRKGPRLGPALALLALVGGLRGASALDAWLASRGPNLVIISIDTLRADRLGAYGYALPTSPTLDRLAAEGVLVEDVYSQSPKTTPSHMTLLTSLYPCVHGVELWWHDEPAHVLSPAVHTLAEVLKNAGYATVAFTGGGQVDRSRGFDQGFDRYSHGQELEKTLRWLDAHRRGKFFLFFHTYLVHDPYVHPLTAEPCSTRWSVCSRRRTGVAGRRRTPKTAIGASGRASSRTTRPTSSSWPASMTPASGAWMKRSWRHCSVVSTRLASPATRSSSSPPIMARRSPSMVTSGTTTCTPRRCVCRSSSASRAG